MGEDLVPSLNICHFILAASWVDTFVKGGLEEEEEEGKVWHYRNVQKAVTVSTSMTPSCPSDLYHGDQDPVKELLLRGPTHLWAVH